MNLVTDRTQADVQERNAKGTYNASDINRVNDAVEEVAAGALQMLTDLEAYRESMGVADDPIFQPYTAGDVDVELPVISEEDPTLPAGYTELEYIQSSGTQYINTDFKPNQDTRVVMDIDVTGQSNVSGCIFGERNANSPAASQAYVAWSMTSGTTVRSDYFGNSVTGSFGILNSRVTIDKNKNVCDFGGTIVTNTEETGQSDLNMYLLACNNLGTPNYYINAKLYSCQIYNNGTLIRDFVPCENPPGEVGLYDIVGQQFYGNAGTGAFTAGPEVQITPPRTTWQREDIPYPTQMTQYLANITTLRGLLPIIGPEVPADMVRLTFQEANAIEEILLLVAQAIQDFQANAEEQIDYIGTYANQLVSGTFFAGSYRTLQHFSRGR